MSDPATTGSVLHIRHDADLSQATDNVTAWLTAAKLSVDSRPDVYRGLARLLRSDENSFPAVIVCVDSLDAPEMEFFALIARIRTATKTYAYGSRRADPRIERAKSLGARGPVSQTDIQALGAASPSNRSACTTTQPPVDTSPPEKPVDDESKTPRVPWKRYDDRPERAAPPHRRGPAEIDAPNRPLEHPAAPPQPLLTEEELEALIGEPDPPQRGEYAP